MKQNYGTIFVKKGGSNLEVVFYDSSMTTPDFKDPMTFLMTSQNIKYIVDFTCQEEKQLGDYSFSCVLSSLTGAITEHFFEYQPTINKVKELNSTVYDQYKDFWVSEVISYKNFIVFKGRSIVQNANSFLVYKRVSMGGSKHLWGGVGNDKFDYRNIDSCDFGLYVYNNIYKLFVQPRNSHSAYVFRIDDLKVQIKDPDLGYLNNVQVKSS